MFFFFLFCLIVNSIKVILRLIFFSACVSRGLEADSHFKFSYRWHYLYSHKLIRVSTNRWSSFIKREAEECIYFTERKRRSGTRLATNWSNALECLVLP